MNIMKPILFNTQTVRAAMDGRKTQMRSVIKNVPNKAECVVASHPWFGFETESDMYHVKPSYQSGNILWVREAWNVNNLREEGDEYEAGFIYKAAEKPDYCFRWVKTSAESYEKYMDGMSLYFDKWRPSIHMPKEAARIFLRVTDVRVERLQDITVDGINSEGIDVEPPVICRNQEPSKEQREKYNRLSDEQKKEYINTLARHRYMGWCKYADDLFREWAKFWDSTIKPSDLDLKGWNANPWVFVYTFERITREEAEAALKEGTT